MAGCKTIEVDSSMSIEYSYHTGPIQSPRSLTLNRVTFHWREMEACEGIWDVLNQLAAPNKKYSSAFDRGSNGNGNSNWKSL